MGIRMGSFISSTRSPVLKGSVRSGVLQQEADDLCVTFGGRHMQRRPAVVVHGFHIHAGQEVPEDDHRRRDHV